MDYKQQHLFNWLVSASLINITELEKLADCPKDTIRHFLKERRNLTGAHYLNICNILMPYGYIPLNAE